MIKISTKTRSVIRWEQSSTSNVSGSLLWWIPAFELASCGRNAYHPSWSRLPDCCPSMDGVEGALVLNTMGVKVVSGYLLLLWSREWLTCNRIGVVCLLRHGPVIVKWCNWKPGRVHLGATTSTITAVFWIREPFWWIFQFKSHLHKV